MSVSPKLQRIAEMAKEHPSRAFTNLAHHIDLDFLREAFRQTRKDGAAGVDGVTGKEYEIDLDNKLQGLLDRFKSGRYRAPDVRRVHIPKGKGKTRPLGIPTFEDKVLQRAVVMILEAVYEQDFLACSYGFRPGRPAHQALAEVRSTLMSMKGGWVVEADIKDCFGAFDREWMRKILGRRIRDGVLIRTIGKWLNAGIIGDGPRTRPTKGTPQGGVISPLLANIFLHDALDAWFHRHARPLIGGRAELVRFADDFVILCDRKEDAERFYKGIFPRFEKFGLILHPEKTKLVPFKRPPRGGPNESESWDFLGFTHYCGHSRAGKFKLKRKTSKKKYRQKVQGMKDWLRANLTTPITEVWPTLNRKLRGHYQYYGVSDNWRNLMSYRDAVQALVSHWIGRRSQRSMSRTKFYGEYLQRHPLARPRRLTNLFA